MNGSVILAWLNGWEVVAILAVVLVLFGAKKLPELAKGLGQGIKEFKKSSREIQDEIQASIDMDEPPAAPKRQIPTETQARVTDTGATSADQPPKA